MDTQNTSVHLRMWHRDFWQMSLANLLLSSMIYMLVPVLPGHLQACHGFSLSDVGAVALAYGVGLFVLGGFTSYLVQRYRRNVVCMASVFTLVLLVGSMYFNEHIPLKHTVGLWLGCALALSVGALMGLAKMTLMSTLVIDSCESSMRTEANYISSWFGRLAIAVGPIIGLACNMLLDFSSTVLVGCGLGFCSLLLVKMARFPFKAPDDNVSLFSSDRFFLLQGFPLFLTLALVTVSAGLVLSTISSINFYGFMLLGFVLSVTSEKVIFSNADLKSEPITGIVCMLLSVIMLSISHLPVVSHAVPVLLGFGLGVTATRFLLFMIKLSRHCQRGTSQSTYFLSWELGISLGISLSYGLVYGNEALSHIVAMAFLLSALLVYNFVVHPWYMKHKNR